MNNFKLLTFLLFVGIFIISNSSKGQLNKVFIKNTGSYDLFFEAQNNFGFFDSYRINKKDTLSIDVNKKGKLLININGNFKLTHIFVLPSDTIELSIKDKSLFVNSNFRKNDFEFLKLTTITFGPIDQVNKEDVVGYPLVQGYKKWKKLDDEFYKKFGKRGTPPPKNNNERDSILFNIYSKKLEFYNEYNRNHKISKQLEDFYLHYIYYQYINQTLQGLLHNDDLITPTYLQNSLNNGQLFSDDYFHINTYKLFLYYYPQYIMKQNNSALNSLQAYDSLIAPTKSKYYVLYKEMNSRFSKGGKPTQNEMDYFLASCDDTTYRNAIQNRLELSILKQSNIKDEDILRSHQKSNQSLQKRIYNDGKKKFFYIDFWASWCIPCINEMKNAQKNRINEDDIEFIYISTDTDINNWELAASKLKILNDNNSFLLVNGNNSPIIKKLRILTVPRYIVIDNLGNVIDDNAPRPSDPNFLNYLKKIKSK